jgi:hypothetical protein
MLAVDDQPLRQVPADAVASSTAQTRCGQRRAAVSSCR